MKKIVFDIDVSPRNVVKVVGVNNTQLISALKTLRANARIIGNTDNVKAITADINKLERYKVNKTSPKRKYYINKQQLNIVSKLNTSYGAIRARPIKGGKIEININKLKASPLTRRIKKKGVSFKKLNYGDLGDIPSDGGYNIGDVGNMELFDSIIKAMGNNFNEAYSKYQDDIDRLAERFGIDLDEYLLAFET